jgi:hypothetical protein
MKCNKKNIPVFYLITKNGGTFTRDCNALIDHTTPILLTKEKKRVIEVYVKNDDKYKNIKDQLESLDDFRKTTSLDCFDQFKEVNIISACILPSGIKKHDELINLIESKSNKKTKKYLGLREPLDRECSKYNYLKSFSSKHENKHNSIKSKSIKEYISSKEMADDVFLRNFLNLEDSNDISKEDLKKAYKILSSFCVFDVKNIKKVIKKALKNLIKIDKYTFSDLNKNKSYGTKIKRDSLTKKQLNDFLSRKKNEYFLYEKLIKKEKKKKYSF